MEGGAKVATIHLRAEVPSRVETIVGSDGSFTVSSNSAGAQLSTQEEQDGVRVNVVSS